MTMKIKLMQEQADFIEKSLANGIDKEEMLNRFAMANSFEKQPSHSLHGLCVMDLARALLIGYEVEPEPLKVGDWALFECGGDIWIAKVGNIMSASYGKKKSYLPDQEIRNFEGRSYYTNVEKIDDISLIKAEKQRRLWKSIGREVREFKVGDAFKYEDGDWDVVVNESCIDLALRRYNSGVLVGILPAESFISFEESEAND